MFVKKLLETTGIDLIPYAVGLSEFRSHPPTEIVKLKDIESKVDSLDLRKLDLALEYVQALLEQDSERGEKADSKAYNLFGITGISAAFITGVSSLRPKDLDVALPFQLVALVVCYVLIVASLTLTILLISRVLSVRKYSYPNIEDVFDMGAKTLKEIKRERLTAYIYCYNKNNQTHNIKISYLMGAQLWFRNSIILFLILALILATSFLSITSVIPPAPVSTDTITPTLSKALTPTPTPKSATPTPVPTTIEPSRTMVSPSAVSIITVTSTP